MSESTARAESSSSVLPARGYFCNAQMGARDLQRHCHVEAGGERLLELAINRLGLSARAYTRILKVARTIADLDGGGPIEARHVSEAIQYRSLDRPAP